MTAVEGSDRAVPPVGPTVSRVLLLPPAAFIRVAAVGRVVNVVGGIVIVVVADVDDSVGGGVRVVTGVVVVIVVAVDIGVTVDGVDIIEAGVGGVDIVDVGGKHGVVNRVVVVIVAVPLIIVGVFVGTLIHDAPTLISGRAELFAIASNNSVTMPTAVADVGSPLVKSDGIPLGAALDVAAAA